MSDPRRAATTTFIGVVAALAVLAAGSAVAVFSLGDLGALSVFVLLALLQVVMPDVIVEGRARVSLASVVLLAGVAIVGPGGAALVGAVIGATSGRGMHLRNRLFNAAQLTLVAVAGGVVFHWAGGTVATERLDGTMAVVRDLAFPLLVADLAQASVNLLTLAAVLRVATGAPMRTQMLAILRGTGLAYIGYGVIALILVVLWRPAGLGPASVAVVLAPLLVAQWVYRQRADELEGQQRALEVLVAALEAKAPHLVGHSARVAELSGHMAEGLGLSPQQVADTRMAGMLHDVGQTSLPTREVRALDLTDPGTDSPYPATGAEILQDLTFLRGALDPIRKHRVVSPHQDSPMTTQIVALADAYDLLTRVGGPSGRVLAPAAARDVLSAQAGAELLRVLDAAIARARAEERIS